MFTTVFNKRRVILTTPLIFHVWIMPVVFSILIIVNRHRVYFKTIWRFSGNTLENTNNTKKSCIYGPWRQMQGHPLWFPFLDFLYFLPLSRLEIIYTRWRAAYGEKKRWAERKALSAKGHLTLAIRWSHGLTVPWCWKISAYIMEKTETRVSTQRNVSVDCLFSYLFNSYIWEKAYMKIPGLSDVVWYWSWFVL